MKPLLLALLLAASSSFADTTDALVDVLKHEEKLGSIHQNLKLFLIQSNPELRQYQSTIDAWSEKHITWQALRPMFTEIYRKHYTEDELKQLLAFYQSPLGQKNLRIGGQLAKEGFSASLNLAKAHGDALSSMLKSEQSRRQTSSKTP